MFTHASPSNAIRRPIILPHQPGEATRIAVWLSGAGLGGGDSAGAEPSHDVVAGKGTELVGVRHETREVGFEGALIGVTGGDRVEFGRAGLAGGFPHYVWVPVSAVEKGFICGVEEGCGLFLPVCLAGGVFSRELRGLAGIMQ